MDKRPTRAAQRRRHTLGDLEANYINVNEQNELMKTRVIVA